MGQLDLSLTLTQRGGDSSGYARLVELNPCLDSLSEQNYDEGENILSSLYSGSVLRRRTALCFEQLLSCL